MTRAVVPVPGRAGDAPGLRRFLPAPLRELEEELDERIASIPTRLNEYGIDPFGFEPGYARQWLLPWAMLYRYWFRVQTRGIEHVPEGRVLLIGNHAGNTFAYDAVMLSMATLLEAKPPRVLRGMAEYYLPKLPFFSTFMRRMGSVVGTPENCVELLEQGEAVMVFPEGQRGFVKPYSKRYRLQEFGLGFMRLALETDTPIVPVGIVGAEEQNPAFYNARWLGRWIGSPAFPLTPTFPWLGLFGFLPLPVKFCITLGEPMHFEGDPNEEDAEVAKKVEEVKTAIRRLIRRGRSARRNWFQ